MKGSTIFKKVLPILAVLLVVIGIAIVVGAVKANANKVSELSKKDDVYLNITETVDGKNYTYSITRGELYTKLKDNIGLSSAITMANKDILKDVKNDEGVSIWDSVTEDEINAEISKACYGEDVDVAELTDEKKAELEETFLNSMYTGYGYDATSLTSPDVLEHYRLVLSKKAYAKYALEKAIKEAAADEPYFSDEKVQDYYDDKYSSSFYAILVPFLSSASFTMTLQQFGVQGKTGGWEKVTLEFNEDKGTYKLTAGANLTTFEVIETIIKMYNLVNPDKMLVEGTCTPKVEEDKVTYEFASDDVDYAIVDMSVEVTEAKNAAAALLAECENSPVDQAAADEKIATAIEKINALKGKTPSDEAVENMLTTIDKIKELVDQTVDPEEQTGNPESLAHDLVDKVNGLSEKTYIFNLNTSSPLYFDYTSLYEYDSSLPNKISSNYLTYSPFVSSANVNSTATWYTATSLTVNSIYYAMVKLGEVEAPKLDEVRDEIIEKLKEDELTDTFVETKMAELREEYEFKFFEKELDSQYVEAMKDYISLKNNKKRSKTVLFSTKLKEYTADDLFKYMEKTSARTTAISEISYQRLLNNQLFNTYKNMETGKWIGEEGKTVKTNIVNQIETQRLYFLTGNYSSYGYDPTTMTWEEFMYQLNGVKDEYELANMLLYSTIASDYIAKALDFAESDGEGIEVALKMDYKDALNSDAWKLVEERMNDMIADYFSVSGEHLLVSLYKDAKDAYNTTDPIDPKEWTDEQKQLAQQLINEIKVYLQSAEGTYATKLQAVVEAYKAAPYAVYKDDKYVDICDSDGNLYKYYLEAGDVKLDLAKYKAYGFVLKYESLGTFGAGEMVENFENAAKEIWTQDMADEVTDRITIYKDPIETEFGYHLYVNLGSNELGKHESVVCDAEGKATDEKVDAVIPSLYEVRAYLLNQLLSSVDTTDLSDEDKKALENKKSELSEILTTDVNTSISSYYSTVSSELTGSYFSAILQQAEIKKLLDNATISSELFNKDDFKNMIEKTFESTYKSNLTHLQVGDEDKFDITKAFESALNK